MKKTLIMIIAIVLVVSVCFALVGCPAKTPEPDKDPCTSHVDANNDGKCDNCGATMPTTPPATEPSKADLEVAAKVASYVEAWLVNNPESHSVNGLNSIGNNYKNKYPKIVSAIRASEQKEGGKVVGYTLTYSFADKTKYTQNIALPTVNNGYHAGATFNGANGGVDADTALGAIINAAFKTCKVAVENGQVFAENGFGFDATAYFDFYYGEMAQKLSYGLRVAGQIGIEAKDTFAGIEVLNGNDVIGGLYYQGAENKADCKLYLNAGDYKYYIDNADINSIVVSVIDAIQGIIGGGEDVEGALADPFYNTEIKKLSELLPAGSGSTIVGAILGGVIKDVNTTKLDANNTQYQVQLDLTALLDELLNGEFSVADLVGDVTSQLPPPLNQLDLGSFQGVGGALLITAVVNDNGLGDLEISYNAPKQDFRFSYEDDQPKVYGPINVAIGIKDFELGQQNASEVIPSDANSYDYFSPLNADVTVDVVVNEVAYSANIVSDINPFAVENGVVTFVVSKDNAEWLNGRLEIVSPAENENGWNALVVVSVDGEVYKFYASDAALAIGEVVSATFESVMTSENIFTPIINYITDLIAQFLPEAQPEVLPAGEEGGFNISAIIGAFDIVDAAKELIAQWQEEGVLVYNLSGETLWDNYLQVKLSADEYNAVIALVNQYIGPIIGMEVPEFENTAAKVFVSANYGDHAKQVYVTVDYKDVSVVVLLDGSKWESNKVVELSVKVNEDLYVAALDASEEGVYNVTYTAKGVTYVDVTVNTNDYTFAATLLANGNTHQFNGSLTQIKEGDKVVGGTITLDLDGVQVSYTGKNAHGALTGETTSFGVPTVTGGVEFGWELPNNKTDVSVEVTLNSWGEAVELADNADLMGLDATAELSTALQELADAFLEAIAVGSAE